MSRFVTNDFDDDVNEDDDTNDNDDDGSPNAICLELVTLQNYENRCYKPLLLLMMIMMTAIY